MSAVRRRLAGTGLTRLLIVLAALFCGPLPARATVGFSCGGEDDAVKFVVNGAYGTALGSGLRRSAPISMCCCHPCRANFERFISTAATSGRTGLSTATSRS